MMISASKPIVVALDRDVAEVLITLRVFMKRVCEHVGLDVVCFLFGPSFLFLAVRI